jgi:hypothetical protein
MAIHGRILLVTTLYSCPNNRKQHQDAQKLELGAFTADRVMIDD